MIGLGFFISCQHSDCDALMGYTGLFWSILATVFYTGRYWTILGYSELYWAVYWGPGLYWAVPRITSWPILSYLRNSPGCWLVRNWSEVRSYLVQSVKTKNREEIQNQDISVAEKVSQSWMQCKQTSLHASWSNCGRCCGETLNNSLKT